MTEIRVKYDKLDWEDYSVPIGAIFNGKKFTGIAIIEHEDAIYEELSFANGIFNGRNFVYDENSKELLQEEFYENGIPVKTHFKWVQNGFFKHIKSYNNGQLVSIKIEDYKKNVLLQFDKELKKFTEWFENGVKSSEKDLLSLENLYEFCKEQFWDKNGIWLMTINNKIDFSYNSKYLLENSDKLYTENEEMIFVHFSEHLLMIDNGLGLSFLKKNIDHINPFFRYQVARLFSKTNDTNSIPFLEKLLKDNLQPETKMKIEWDGSGTIKKTQYSISKMAEIAIENIKINNRNTRVNNFDY